MEEKKKQGSVLKGCLIAAGIFVVLAAIGVWLTVRSVGSFFSEAYKEVEAEFVADEKEIKALSILDIPEISFEKYLSLSKEEASKLDGKVYLIKAVVSSEDFSHNIPFKMPVGFLVIQPSKAKPNRETEVAACMYSMPEKPKFDGLKAGDPVTLRAKIQVDDDGDMSLQPCVREE